MRTANEIIKAHRALEEAERRCPCEMHRRAAEASARITGPVYAALMIEGAKMRLPHEVALAA